MVVATDFGYIIGRGIGG